MELTIINQTVNSIPNGGSGLIVEACQILKTAIAESNQLLLSVYRIIPSTFPFFCHSYLKKIQNLDARGTGLRNLYQLSRKSPTKGTSS